MVSASDDEGLTLALEASGGAASAAVGRGGVVLGYACRAADYGHAAWMVSLADRAMSDAGSGAGSAGYSAVERVLGGAGPGSFTGIRVALAAAKGFALAAEVEAQGVSSLAALAAGAAAEKSDSPGLIVSAIDSRRRTLFCQVFSSRLEILTEVFDGDAGACAAKIIGQIVSEREPPNLIVVGHEVVNLSVSLKKLAAIAGVEVDVIIPYGSDSHPDASGVLKAVALNPALVIPPTPLYLAPPILGGGKKS